MARVLYRAVLHELLGRTDTARRVWPLGRLTRRLWAGPMPRRVWWP